MEDEIVGCGWDTGVLLMLMNRNSNLARLLQLLAVGAVVSDLAIVRGRFAGDSGGVIRSICGSVLPLEV